MPNMLDILEDAMTGASSTYDRITMATDQEVLVAAAQGVAEVLAIISEKSSKDSELLRSNLYFARLFAAQRFHVARDGYWSPTYNDVNHPRLRGSVYNAWIAAVATQKEK